MTLNLAPVRGSVLITSDPLGAKVTMDGKNQGLTPLVLRDLAPGEYSAQIEHVNRAPRVVKWSITDMRPKKVSASLDSDIGKLVLITDPPRARVYINGKVSGLTPFRTDLQEGEHKIRVALTGFADVKAMVNIVRDKQTTKKNYHDSSAGYSGFPEYAAGSAGLYKRQGIRQDSAESTRLASDHRRQNHTRSGLKKTVLTV